MRLRAARKGSAAAKTSRMRSSAASKGKNHGVLNAAFGKETGRQTTIMARRLFSFEVKGATAVKRRLRAVITWPCQTANAASFALPDKCHAALFWAGTGPQSGTAAAEPKHETRRERESALKATRSIQMWVKLARRRPGGDNPRMLFVFQSANFILAKTWPTQGKLEASPRPPKAGFSTGPVWGGQERIDLWGMTSRRTGTEPDERQNGRNCGRLPRKGSDDGGALPSFCCSRSATFSRREGQTWLPCASP